MDSLAPLLASYVDTTKRITELNAALSDLRDTRSTIELDLAALYSTKQLPDRVDLRWTASSRFREC